jgi:hypothetical protein
MASDKKLIEEARRGGGRRTKKKAGFADNDAHRDGLRILLAFGTIDFDPHFDYQAERMKKRHE